MSGAEVVVLPTGAANMASVMAGLRRCGARPVRSVDPQRVAEASRLVVPGVGTLRTAVEQLGDDGTLEPLRERLARGRPTLAICLGFQLWARGSDESPGVEGLGLLPLRSRRFPGEVRVPQLGWNRVEPEGEGENGRRWIGGGYAYFANSYCIDRAPAENWRVAWARHGVPFVAAAARGRLLGCQFHPELSGAWGRDLLSWWLDGGEA
jgi:imidazole glycerol phosphate synthase glutamine amidotransferase subunit